MIAIGRARRCSLYFKDSFRTRLGLSYSEVDDLQIVRILWISWDGSIANRRGYGEILLSAWEKLDTKEVDIVLG